MATPSSSTRSGNRGRLLIAGLALLLIVVVVAIVKVIQGAPVAGGPGGGGPGGPPPAAVFVVPIQTMTAREEARVTGVLRAVSRSEIAAQEPEAVAEVLVDEGDRVQKDQPLVVLDGRRLTTQSAEAAARLESSRELVNQRMAERERAQADLDMKEGLLRDRAVSRSEYLDAARALAVARAQHESAVQAVAESESRVALLEIRRGDLEIKAPFPGVVAERHVEPGEWIGAGEPVVTLVTIDPVEAWLSVPERFLGDVTGNPDNIRVRLSSSGEIFDPSAVTAVPDVESRSQLFTVVATLSNSDARLAPGQSVTGIVPVGLDEPHYVFPVDALVRARLSDFIYVVGQAEAGGAPVAQKVPVTVHFERDERAYVRAADSPLEPAARVVVEGNDRLQPGQPLLVRDRESGPSETVPPPKL